MHGRHPASPSPVHTAGYFFAFVLLVCSLSACGSAPEGDDGARDGAVADAGGDRTDADADGGAPCEGDDCPPAAPVLESAERSGAGIVLRFRQPERSLIPEGGYDTYVNGVDLNDTAEHAGFERVIEGLGAAREHCFTLEARYTQLDPAEFLESNELCVPASEPVLAFPGAVGPNVENITGGRDGTLCFVTTTALDGSGSHDAATDTDSGSLDYCWGLDVPSKTIVFRISGVFATSDISRLYQSGNGSNHGNITLLGYTAPFPGVFIYGSTLVNDNGAGNLIIRGITVLTGAHAEFARHDGIGVYGSPDVIIADVTAGWSADEDISLTGRNSTQQYNLLLEGFPNHSKAGIMGPAAAHVGREVHDVAGHHSVAIHVQNRLFNTGMDALSQADMWNNCGYNFAGRAFSMICNNRFNYVANYFRWNRDDEAHAFYWNGSHQHVEGCGIPDASFYWADNVVTDPSGATTYSNVGGAGGDRALGEHHISAAGYTAGHALPDEWFVDEPFAWLDERAHVSSAEEAYEELVVAGEVGSRWYMDETGTVQTHHEPFVQAYLDDFIHGTTHAFRNDSDAFTRPTVSPSGTAYVDTDRDGMADAFEDAHGLDRDDPSDGTEVQSHWVFGEETWTNPGYPNREVFFYQHDIRRGLE